MQLFGQLLIVLSGTYALSISVEHALTKLYNPLEEEVVDEPIRVKRRAVQGDLCSYKMQNITRMAKVTGHFMMAVDDFGLYRRTRQLRPNINLDQPVGKFCMKLWRKLVRVHEDLSVLQALMNEYNIMPKLVKDLVEALQEQMNIHKVNYEAFNERSESPMPSGRFNMDKVKERVHVQFLHVLNELNSLDLSCGLERRRRGPNSGY